MNFQESTTILNACTKKVWKLIEGTTYIYTLYLLYIYIYIYIYTLSTIYVVHTISLKQNFIAYRSSKVSSRPDCIFEIHQLWQSGFSRVYSNSCCSSSFEREILKIGQSSHKMYSNNILNFWESTTILNACTKKGWKLIIFEHLEVIGWKWRLPHRVLRAEKLLTS